MIETRTILLILALALIAGSVFYLQSGKLPGGNNVVGENTEIEIDFSTMEREEKATRYEVAKEITTPDGFINVDSISIGELIGKKVVLVDFWTYSCINCQRTLPYLNTWHEKYKDEGLIIIGVHTPEFQFEQKYENVLAAVRKFGVKYPVVLDNDYSTWHAYKNRYWPRKYLIDIDGFIVYDHIGEGGYEETEKKIQELLGERMTALGIAGKIEEAVVEPEGVEEVNIAFRRSPEIYFGAARNQNFGNGIPGVVGVQTLTEPDDIGKNTLYLVGEWDITPEYAENKSTEAKIIFRYEAEKVFFVASGGDGVSVRVLRDGVPLGGVAGSDIDEDSKVFIKEDRLYRLIKNSGPGEHILEIIIEGSGLRAFTFTFG